MAHPHRSPANRSAGCEKDRAVGTAARITSATLPAPAGSRGWSACARSAFASLLVLVVVVAVGEVFVVVGDRQVGMHMFVTA